MATGLFGWALSTLKETVIAPFSGSTVEPEPMHVAPPPPTRIAMLQQKRKSKAASKEAARARAEELAMKRYLGANEVEDETCIKDVDTESEEESEEPVSLLTPEQQAALEKKEQKLAKKKARETERWQLRQAKLEKSRVKELPADPQEENRQAIIDEIRTKLSKIEKFDGKKYDQIMDTFRDVQAELDALSAEIDEKERDFLKKNPRVTVPDEVTLESMRAEIQRYEVSAACDQTMLERRIEELTHLVTSENNKEFQKVMSTFRDMIEERKISNQRLLDLTREADSLERVAARVQTIMRFEDESVEVKPSDIIRLGVDLSSEAPSVLFQPQMQVRKIERKFKCVIESQRMNGRPSRTVAIWGCPENANTCLAWLKAADFSGRLKKSFDKRELGGIIGRGGSRLLSLETDHNVLINVGTSNEVVIYGSPSDAADVWDAIEKQKQEVQVDTRGTRVIELESILARAAYAIHRTVIQTLEAEYDARITVHSRPNENAEREQPTFVPRILIRGRGDKIDELEKKVKAEIVDSLSLLTFAASARAITRVLVPPRNLQNATARLLNEEYKVLRETYALFVDRQGERDPNSDGSETQMLHVVCSRSQADVVKEKVQDLLNRAAYIQERIPIDREQLRIFSQENRSLIQASSQCKFGVQPGDQQTWLVLTGSEEAVDAGKRVVAEILAREGNVHTYNFEEPELIGQLLMNHGAKIHCIELQTSTFITVNRQQNLAKIVGNEKGIEEAVSELDTATEEIRQEKKDAETLVIDIDSEQIAQVIGRGGTNIREIRSLPGIKSIDVPQKSTEEPSPVASIRITGTKQGCDAAQARIEQLLRIRPREQQQQGAKQPAARGRGRGRGRATREVPISEEPGKESSSPVGATTSVAAADDEDEFPALEASFDRR